MSSTELVATIINSLVLASALSLVTLGYVVVFRASRVFNFAQPDLMLIGAFIYLSVYEPGVPGAVFATLVALVVVGAIAWILYVVVLDRAAGEHHWMQMILTMGVSIVAVNVVQLIWGGHVRFLELGAPPERIELVDGVTLTTVDLTVLVVGIALSAFFYWVLSASPLAFRLKATAENPALAAYCGIRLRRWFGIAWALGGGAAAVGGIVYASRVPVDTALVDVGLVAFPAALLGGMDSVSGAFVGAIILAFVQQFATALISPEIATPLSFALALLVLLFRPRGLFGSVAVERV